VVTGTHLYTVENKLDDIYRNLNKKLCILKRTNNNQNKTTSQMTKHNLYTRTKNLSQVGADKEELELLKLGQNYAIEKS
jgi:flagellar hook-associated protein FlgK